jgi:hypothetical protein
LVLRAEFSDSDSKEGQKLTPTARLAALRCAGFLCAVVERWIPYVNRRRDMFGCFDILALHPVRREIALIQTTTAGNMAARVNTVKATSELPGLLAAGCSIQVWGWSKRGKRWRVKIVELRSPSP